jgi:uncharacterized protein
VANVPEPATGKEPPKPKPVAGPIQSLTGPALAPGGELASRMTAAKTKPNEAESVIEQTLRQGRPLAPKPGRSDDYVWPRD